MVGVEVRGLRLGWVLGRGPGLYQGAAAVSATQWSVEGRGGASLLPALRVGRREALGPGGPTQPGTVRRDLTSPALAPEPQHGFIRSPKELTNPIICLGWCGVVLV